MTETADYIDLRGLLKSCDDIFVKKEGRLRLEAALFLGEVIRGLLRWRVSFSA